MADFEFTPEVIDEKCRCCGGHTSKFSSANVLKFIATYRKCDVCESVQVEDPYWIEDAHEKAISSFDTGLVSRCLSASRLISTFLFLEGKGCVTGIDWGGGTGLLTRLLRDQGFRAKSYDKYADGELAEGFTGTLEDALEKATFLSAIECFEHLTDPIGAFQEVTAKKDYFIFTTEIIETPPPDPVLRSWWYFMPESGQHITFASKEGIDKFKEILGFEHYIRFGSLHVMSRSKCNRRTRFILSIRFIRGAVIILIPEFLNRKYSLTISDNEDMLHRQRS